MPLQYGLNITKSDMQKMLEQNDKQQNGIRTWRSLFGNAGLGANAQSDAITSQYTDAIAQAYKANFEQQNAVQNSGLGAGAVKEYLALTRQELQNTYNNYLSNYASDLNDTQESYNNEVGIYKDALEGRAQNFADLYNNAYTYLSEELFGATRTYDDWNNTTPIVEDSGGKDPKVTGYAPSTATEDYFKTHGLEWLQNDDGTLKSWNELSTVLLNDDGTFSDKGKLFFDQMFNAQSAELNDFTRTDEKGNEYKVRGFDEWLSEKNPELRDWWVSGDAYNYNFAGSNAGSAKAYAGLESTDNSPQRYTPEILDSFVNDNQMKGVEGLDRIEKGFNDVANYDRNNLSSKQRKEKSAQLDTLQRHYGDKLNSTKDEFFKNWDTVLTNMQNTLSNDWGKFYEENKDLIERLEAFKDFDFYYDTELRDDAGKRSLKGIQDKYKEFTSLYEQLLNKLKGYGKSRKPSGF